MSEEIKNEQVEENAADVLASRVAHRERIFRRIGYSIFGGIILIVGGFLVYSAFHGIEMKTVYDPFTGENVFEKSGSSEAPRAE